MSAPPVRYGVLAAALLGLELLAGMQSYLLSTVVPVVAQDLDAHEYYGVMTAAAQVAMFLTMPAGPYLLQRVPVGRLLVHLTWLSVAGGVVSAAAPSVAVFVLGRALTGLASGALATVSLAAVVAVLPAGWRRAVLGGYSAMWVCTSLIGPAYAAWVTAALSWRWALVGYLPLLLVARVVVARQLRAGLDLGGARERLPAASAVVLATGVGVLAVVGVRGVPPVAAVVAGAAGSALAVGAASRLLPPGVLRLRRGRPAGVATLGLTTAAYFGAAAIVAIAVHDVLGGSTADVARVLTVGGLGWAVVGLLTARWPARDAGRYRARAAGGAVLLAGGLVAVAAAVTGRVGPDGVPVVVAGWGAAGAGIGLLYLDALNRVVDPPPEVDGVTVPRAAAAAVLVEAVASAVAATLCAALVGRAVAAPRPAAATATALVLLGLAVVALSAGAVAARAWGARVAR